MKKCVYFYFSVPVFSKQTVWNRTKSGTFKRVNYSKKIRLERDYVVLFPRATEEKTEIFLNTFHVEGNFRLF